MRSYASPLATGALLVSLALTASTARAQAPPDSTGIPYVSQVSTDPAVPFATQPITLLVSGMIPSCFTFAGSWPVDTSQVEILWHSEGAEICQSLRPWQTSIELGTLPPGHHTIDILLRHVAYLTDSAGASDSTVYDYHMPYTFLVYEAPPSPLPYVDHVYIGPVAQPPSEGPVCANDSIQVQVHGTFPNSCFRVVGVQVIPSRRVPAFPSPPAVRVVIEDFGACVNSVCIPAAYPWDALVNLPPLPQGPYELPVVLSQIVCAQPGDTTSQLAKVPFHVTPPCGPPPIGCLSGVWGRADSSGCNARVGPGDPAALDFAIASPVALAGLQGEFHLYPPQLVITNLEAVGPAASMHVQWRPSPDGAKFTMFAEHGAPIPPAYSSADSNVRRMPVPILRLTLRQTGPLSGPRTSVFAGGLLGSDEYGNGVPECAYPTMFEAVYASVCSAPDCDVNHDGLTDVRDLVLMVHCVAGVDSAGGGFRTACQDSSDIPDCNRDGRHSIEDVLCCGRRILRGFDCPGCPPDSTHARPAPEVHASLGAPEFGDREVRIPIAMDGLGSVGGALLRMSYPSDRYDAALDLPVESYDWLMLADVNDGVATLGAIRLGDPPPDKALAARFVAAPLQLRLTLKPGKSHGGTVAIQSSEFSGTDGAMLATTNDATPHSLGGAPSLALSAAQPNPFNGTTRFQLTLDRSASAEVGIYDLGGRLVARLHRGTLDAGAHDFTWNGVRDGGGVAASGVYFYRATSGSTTVSRKMVRIGS